MGDPRGACDFSPQILKKVISTVIRDDLRDIPSELWSPAYEALQNFRISELQIGQVFKYWEELGTDGPDFNPRKAACKWVVDNFDRVLSFVPPSHPRTIEVYELKKSSIRLVSLVLSCITLLILAISAFATRSMRKKKAIFYGQETVLYSILSGLMLVAVGALLLTLPPGDGTCLAVAWITNLGYCFALVPLLLRLGAIHALLQSGKAMQRVRLSPSKLMYSLGASATAVAAFLLVWTLVDAPRKTVEYEATEHLSQNGEVLIHEVYQCSSNSGLWMLLNMAWKAILLLISLMIAYLALSVREDINDTRAVTAVVASHAFFSL